MTYRQPRVFISHSWADKLQAERLAEAIANVADVWMDYRRLQPGDPIQQSIDETLQEMDAVLLLWSSQAAVSDGVAAELASCETLGVRVVPCFIEYDDQGAPAPPLKGALADTLGQDLKHFGTGVARLSTLLLELQDEALDAFEQDPRKRLLQELDGMLDYLSHYLKDRGGSAPRTAWVERICEVLEEFVAQGGDAAQLQPLLAAAHRHLANDPEALALLISRLEPMLQDVPAEAIRAQLESPMKKKKKKKKRKHGRAQRREEAQDELARRIEQAAPPGMAPQWLARVQYYLDVAPQLINGMHYYSVGVGSPAGCEVVNFLNTYLQHADDLIPDTHGRYGLLDDAWLINNTAYRLLESQVVPANVLMAQWPLVVEGDQIVRALMPVAVTAALEGYLMQLLGIIANEVQGYRPQFGGGSFGEPSTEERWNTVFGDYIQNM